MIQCEVGFAERESENSCFFTSRETNRFNLDILDVESTEAIPFSRVETP